MKTVAMPRRLKLYNHAFKKKILNPFNELYKTMFEAA